MLNHIGHDIQDFRPPGTRFRVKLYGHMGRDDEAFAKRLSALLAVEESDAQCILRSVPTVIREELGEAQAHSLCEALKASGALCLTEPTEYHEMAHPRAVDLVVQVPTEEAREQKNARDTRLSIAWIAFFACALLVVVSLAAVSLWSSYSRMTETFGPAPRAPEPERPEGTRHAPPQEPAKSLQQLYTETEEVERNLEHLRFIANLREREFNAVAGAYRADRNMVRERRALWERARADVDAEAKKLREMKAEITKTEMQPSP